MVKKRELTNEEKLQIVKLYGEELRVSEIVKKTQFKRSTVVNVMKKWKITNTVRNKQRKGRPRCTTTREDRKIVQLATVDRRMTLCDLTKQARNNYQIDASSKTIKRRLHEVGLYGRRARKKPMLSRKNIAKRFQWAKEHETWTTKDWARVLWSDESKFCIFGNNGSRFIWRRPNEALKIQCVLPTVKHGGGTLF